MPGRNDPCPCESGRKFKKCCGARLEAIAEFNRLETEVLPLYLEIAQAENLPVKEALKALVGHAGDLEAREFQWAIAWALYDEKFVGRTIADRVRSRVRPEIVRWMDNRVASWLSIWRIERVVPEVGLELHDALTGEVRFVFERSGTRDTFPGLHLLARVVEYAGGHLMTSVHHRPLGPSEAADVIARFRSEWFPGWAEVQPEDLQDLPVAKSLLALWREAALQPARLPQLANFDGDPLQMVRDVATVRADRRDAIRARLGALQADPFEEGGRWGITLTRAPREPRAGMETVSWGRAILGAEELTLEANSLRRADDLQALVKATLAGLMTEPFRRELVPLDLSREPGPRAPIPPELAELVRRKKEVLYRGWSREKLPALGGRTAAEEVRTTAGRLRVKALLAQMEEAESQLPEAERFDFDRLRAELGLLER